MTKYELGPVSFTMNSRRIRFLIQFPGSVFSICNERLPNYACVGLSSRCEDDNYVVMLDYDKFDFFELTHDIHALQKQFPQLGYALLYTSKQFSENVYNWFVVFVSKMTFKEMWDVMNASKCDRQYLVMVNRRDDKTPIMRVTEKEDMIADKKASRLYKFFGICNNESYPSCIASQAHFDFLDKRFGGLTENFKWFKNYSFDKSKHVEVVSYGTAGD